MVRAGKMVGGTLIIDSSHQLKTKTFINQSFELNSLASVLASQILYILYFIIN